VNSPDFGAHIRSIIHGTQNNEPVPDVPRPPGSLVVPVTAPIDEEPPLSPSEVNTFFACSARWNFKYRERFPNSTTGALAVGISFHTAQKVNFSQKRETGEDLPLEGVRMVFRDAWNELLESTQFRDDEEPDELKACGEALLTKYMDEAAPRIQPAEVELPVSGMIGGVKVSGKIDLLDVYGRIIDIKTAGKKPSWIDPNYRFQVATYKRLEPRASGEARLETVTKTKTIQLVQQTFTINQADRQSIETLYPLALQGMRAGIYWPNRASYFCSRDHCPFWRACEARYGGTVKGGDR
jgi:PD-(D/E)XK nuclease superfamily protein